MAVIAGKRSVMTLFTGSTCIHSHRVRIVLGEKGISYEVLETTEENPPEDLLTLNPYGTIPTLIDRDLVLYDPQVMIEYLDERFPHPPLMPVDPVSRAQCRLAVCRILQDLYVFIDDIENGSDRKANKARKGLKEALIASSEVFAANKYFLSEDFSVMDATIAPILWRLPLYGIELPSEGAIINEYAERVFEREAFQNSLTDAELEIREE